MSEDLFKPEDVAGHEYADDPRAHEAYFAGHIAGQKYLRDLLLDVHPWVAVWRAIMRPMRWRS
jgi:hypothetical protein